MEVKDKRMLYQDWVWISPQSVLELIKKDLERGYMTIQDIQGSQVRVFTYLEGDKLRAYCVDCQSTECIHSYIAIDRAIRRLIRFSLEVNTFSRKEAHIIYKRLTKREKIEILEKLGIDTDDLRNYINRMGRKNAQEIALWSENLGLPRRYLF
jgi:hypothetical protein